MKVRELNTRQNGITPAYPNPTYFGLTKRELFAAMAMQGLLSNSRALGEAADIVCDAVMCADALLAELEKVKP